MTTTETIWEGHLARRLGIGRAEIRKARNSFSQGQDWWFEGNRVVWTISSLDKLANIFAKQGRQDLLSPETSPGPSLTEKPQPDLTLSASLCSPEPPIIVSILCPLPNKHYLCGVLNGRKVAVKVRDNSRYRRGMEVEVVSITNHIYEAVTRPWKPPTQIPNQPPPG